MQIPASLHERIESIIERKPMKTLQQRWAEMSTGYRGGNIPELDEISALSYLVGRMPATYAACKRALDIAVQLHQPDFKTHLDAGAGPGAAIWAAREIWPSLSSTAVERAPAWLKVGPEITPSVRWLRGDLTSASSLPKAELVTAAYVLNELPADEFKQVLLRLWEACEGWLVLVEPGTPQGYQRVLAARELLSESGAHVVAPCPGRVSCPLQGTPQWCHFGVRLNRPRFQKLTKGADVSWEDERLSFMVMSRSPVPVPEGRVLHHPQKRGGHVWVELCSQQGLHKQVLSRRDGSLYKATRRLHWGDSFPPVASSLEAFEEDDSSL